jgi:hypothetical protein
MQKQCYVVPSTITKSVEIQQAVILVYLINSCGSVSPAINERKETGLLRHNIKNAINNYYPERKHQFLTIEFTDFVNMIKR